MPIETIVWPWWYGVIICVSFAAGMLWLMSILGKDRDDDN
jgi:hypothetical protein